MSAFCGRQPFFEDDHGVMFLKGKRTWVMRNQGASNKNPQRHNFCVPIHINCFVLQGQNNPDKYNSSKEGLILMRGLRSPAWWDSHNYRSLRTLVRCTSSQYAEEDDCWCSETCSYLFSQGQCCPQLVCSFNFC